MHKQFVDTLTTFMELKQRDKYEHLYKSTWFDRLQVWSIQMCVNIVLRRKDISNDLSKAAVCA